MIWRYIPVRAWSMFGKQTLKNMNHDTRAWSTSTISQTFGLRVENAVSGSRLCRTRSTLSLFETSKDSTLDVLHQVIARVVMYPSGVLHTFISTPP
jgi:hypothetical protein